jgi:hypothetical protein
MVSGDGFSSAKMLEELEQIRNSALTIPVSRILFMNYPNATKLIQYSSVTIQSGLKVSYNEKFFGLYQGLNYSIM